MRCLPKKKPNECGGKKKNVWGSRCFFFLIVSIGNGLNIGVDLIPREENGAGLEFRGSASKFEWAPLLFWCRPPTNAADHLQISSKSTANDGQKMRPPPAAAAAAAPPPRNIIIYKFMELNTWCMRFIYLLFELSCWYIRPLFMLRYIFVRIMAISYRRRITCGGYIRNNNHRWNAFKFEEIVCSDDDEETQIKRWRYLSLRFDRQTKRFQSSQFLAVNYHPLTTSQQSSPLLPPPSSTSSIPISYQSINRPDFIHSLDLLNSWHAFHGN